jgi:hypothetical protein
MIHVPEPRLLKPLLAPIIQARITVTANISRTRCIENHYHPMQDPAVRWRKEGNQ